ncbi:MAG: hypothetical protein A2W35_02235 [Chloroflexi bacterium RBG_16_57_11]|nr:MAG: hypothetical protein A2W35_02235 [Chloroflexi bacterium RBG_16_57_11]
MELVLRGFTFLTGVILVIGTVFSAVETFVLPRGVSDRLTRLVFMGVRFLITLPLKRARSFEARDRIMAFYAPLGLLALVPVWYFIIAIGYAAIYWSMGVAGFQDAFLISGSSLFTLGSEAPQGFPMTLLAFSESMIGLILVAMLIAYLPTMYAAFSRRESAVTMLEVRAGKPPSAIEMLLRYHRIHGLQRLSVLWPVWETWFADIDESHTSLPALVFFRSPRSDHSWVTSAGAVLDAASLTLAAVDIPADPQAMLCIRAGYLALRHVADFFHLPHNPNPHFPSEPISITRVEFDAAWEQLAEAGVPLKTDHEQAWLDFAGWRVNYDRALLGLCRLTLAPVAPWSSDRVPQSILPPNLFL